MGAVDGEQRRRHVVAQRLAHLGAARVEAAAVGRVGRRRDVAGEDDPLALVAADRVGHRHGRQQRLGVRVRRAGGTRRRGVPTSTISAEVHHRDAVAEVLDDGEVVGHEQDREAEAPLQVAQQVEDLRADRHVERRHRLVGDEELRLDGEGPGDADALALPAAELVREAPGAGAGRGRRGRAPRRRAACARRLSTPVGAQPFGDRVADRRPRVERRVRDPGTRPGCSCAAPAARRASAASRSWPSKCSVPSSGSSSRSRMRDSVVLPQPDSPTRPSTSPS